MIDLGIRYGIAVAVAHDAGAPHAMIQTAAEIALGILCGPGIVTWTPVVDTAISAMTELAIEVTGQPVGVAVDLQTKPETGHATATAALVAIGSGIDHDQKTGIMIVAVIAVGTENENMITTALGVPGPLVHQCAGFRVLVGLEAARAPSPEPVIVLVHGLGVVRLRLLWISTDMCHLQATEANHLGGVYDHPSESGTETREEEALTSIDICLCLNSMNGKRIKTKNLAKLPKPPPKSIQQKKRRKRSQRRATSVDLVGRVRLGGGAPVLGGVAVDAEVLAGAEAGVEEEFAVDEEVQVVVAVAVAGGTGVDECYPMFQRNQKNPP